MHRLKYLILFLLFTVTFVNAERNPLLDIKKDISGGGIIDIGVNEESADQLTVYLKELVSSPPSKRTYPQEVLLQERNVTREDCIFDQFGVEGCTLNTINCENVGESFNTTGVDHQNTISGIEKIKKLIGTHTETINDFPTVFDPYSDIYVGIDFLKKNQQVYLYLNTEYTSFNNSIESSDFYIFGSWVWWFSKPPIYPYTYTINREKDSYGKNYYPGVKGYAYYNNNNTKFLFSLINLGNANQIINANQVIFGRINTVSIRLKYHDLSNNDNAYFYIKDRNGVLKKYQLKLPSALKITSYYNINNSKDVVLLKYNPNTGKIIYVSPYIISSETKTINDYEYVCPYGFSDSENDKTKPGNTCKKTYTWRTYSCPSDVNENGMEWIGPKNSGGDCSGVGVLDGGVCPDQPKVYNANCTRALYQCPLNSEIKCLANPKETELLNIYNGYKYIAGFSKQHSKTKEELKLCPETQNPIFFCPTGWDKTDTTRECVKKIAQNEIQDGDSQDDCNDGYRYSMVAEKCIAINNLAKEIVVDENNDIYYLTTQSIGFDDTLGLCVSYQTPKCTEAGYTYNNELGKCVKNILCEGTIVDGQCLQEPTPNCASGMSYDIETQNCKGQVQCEIGTFNNSTGKCEDSSMQCPSGMTFNRDIFKCEKPMDTQEPSCPEDFLTFNPTTELCEGTANFSDWENPDSNGVWSYNANNNTLYQSYNGNNTYYISPVKYKSSIFEGVFSVGDDNDDDWAGLTFGYDDFNNNYVFQWKKHDQNWGDNIKGEEGFSLMRFNNGTREYLKTNFSTTSGWEYNTEYRMKIIFTSTTFNAYINDVNVLSFSFSESSGQTFPTEGKAGFFNQSQSEVTYKDFTIKTKAICNSGYILNESYAICYKDEGPEYTYNFENKTTYTDATCPSGGVFDTNTNKCTYNSICPSGYSKSGNFCYSNPNWTCDSTNWRYQSSPSPFADLTGSCIVPQTCPSGTTKEGNYCISSQITASCEEGYTPTQIENTIRCLAPGYCKENWIENENTCSITYFWSEYVCPEEWEGPLTQAGGDCDGSCNYNNCNCDDPNPPANNCRQLTTDTNEGVKIEKRRPMQLHNILSGETLGKLDFGTMRSQKCSENPEDCPNYIDEIRGENNKLCFRKSRTQEEECFEVDGCTFNGKLIAVQQLKGTINIQAYNSKFDYADPQDPDHLYWDASGFSIGRHALLLSDGNWYISQNDPTYNGSSIRRGCGDDKINGLGGSQGFKTLPNSSYHIIEAYPASSCLYSDKPVSGDCAKNIDIDLPDGLTLISISDLESVVSNVFGTNACNGDNTYNENFLVNYDVSVHREGSGVLTGTSFTSDDGSAVIDGGYGHDVMHSLTLVDKNTLFSGFEKKLGFRGVPSCGVYEYDPVSNNCKTPIDYSKWSKYGDDSNWVERNDIHGNKVMFQSVNTTKEAFFISPYEFDTYSIEGDVGIGIDGDCNDDDTVGIVFGYKNEKNFYGIFWGGDIMSLDLSWGERYCINHQDSSACLKINNKWWLIGGGTTYAGGLLENRGTDNFPSYRNNGLTLLKVVDGVKYELASLPNSDGWKCGVYTKFKITSNEEGIKVWKNNNLIFNVPNEQAPEGKSGYFGYSQANAYYKDFTVSKTPSCPIGTKLDPNTDRCKEITCPRNLVLNKDTGMCQQVIKSTCAMNGNVGWLERTGGIVSVGSSEEAKSYIVLSVNDAPDTLADFGDGTKWKGFNTATMAIKLSDGYWYVSSYLRDTNGIDLSSQRELPLNIRYLNPSNYIDLEDLNGSKTPILCNFKGKALKQSICSRKVKITLPGFGKTVEAIADIESLFEISNPSYDKEEETSNNVFTNYKITANISKTLDYSGVGQMQAIKFDKADTLIENDPVFLINDRLRFWDSYEDGYIGFIEFIRQVKNEDKADMFMPENPTPFDLNGLGFTSIGVLDENDGYINDVNYKTYFIKPIPSKDSTYCSKIADGFNLIVHNGDYGNDDLNKIAKVMGAYNPNACVLEEIGYNTPDSVNWAVRTEYSTQGFDFVCSPYKCQSDHYCEKAECPPEYHGGVYPDNYEREYPIGSVSPNSCEKDACDTINPYEPVCGKEIGCDKENPRIIELPNGDCQEIYCPTSAGYFNSQTGLCEKMACPYGTHEISSGDCIKD